MKRYIWDVLNDSQMGRYLTSVEMNFIEQSLEQEGNIRTILDAGGGSGRFAIPLTAKGYDITVLEVQDLPLWWIKARSPDTSALRISSKTLGWPIKSASMDCVLAIQVPMIKFDWFWQECHRILKPNGIVVICMMNRTSYKGALYQTRPLVRPFLSEKGKRWADRENFYALSAQDVRQIFEANRFQLDEVLGYSWMPVGRSSQFPLLPSMAALEEKLGLRKLAFQSPWVLFKAKREPERLGDY